MPGLFGRVVDNRELDEFGCHKVGGNAHPAGAVGLTEGDCEAEPYHTGLVDVFRVVEQDCGAPPADAV